MNLYIDINIYSKELFSAAEDTSSLMSIFSDNMSPILSFDLFLWFITQNL